MKRCSKCRAEKPTADFGKNRCRHDGMNNQCKACSRERGRAWYAANTERDAERTRAWKKSNPERHAEHGRKWCEANPERRNAIVRKRAAREGAGVYSITCVVTGEVYIGSTVRGFVGRFEQHRSKLINSKHRNKRLQALHDAYGAESLVYRKLAILEPEMCRRTEQALIERTPNCINVIRAVRRARRVA